MNVMAAGVLLLRELLIGSLRPRLNSPHRSSRADFIMLDIGSL